jgi:hypothetical protein
MREPTRTKYSYEAPLFLLPPSFPTIEKGPRSRPKAKEGRKNGDWKLAHLEAEGRALPEPGSAAILDLEELEEGVRVNLTPVRIMAKNK